jgi:predicted lipoprotein with Yx(FWY)xxD motif
LDALPCGRNGKDDNKQWAYKGKPLYTFAKDTKPGDTTGDGVGMVWHIAMP